MQSILAINGGSSSIKFALYQVGEPLKRRLHGMIDRIGLSGTNLTFNDPTRNTQDRAVRFLAAYADEHKLNVSLVDLKALAAGFVDSIPLVTDDGDMKKVADAHGIECWSIIKLLKLLRSAGRIDDETVVEVLEYLEFERDLPMPIDRLRRVFKEYFGTDCPV